MRLDDCDESVFGTYHRVRWNDLVQSAEGLRILLLLSNFQSSNLIDPKDVHFSAFFEYDCNVRSWNWQENLFKVSRYQSKNLPLSRLQTHETELGLLGLESLELSFLPVEFDLDVTEILNTVSKIGHPDDVCGLFKPFRQRFEF